MKKNRVELVYKRQKGLSTSKRLLTRQPRELEKLTLMVLSYDALITIELDRKRKLQIPR